MKTWLGRVLREPIRAAVAEALATRDADGTPPPYNYRVHGNRARVHIHPTAILNDALLNVSGGTVTVAEYAFFGHHCAILTGSHDIEKFGRERQTAIVRSGRDVVVEEGVWLSSFVVVQGPCVIGAHSVVAPGSVVVKDVEPFTVVGGRPANLLRRIEARPGK